MKVDFSVVLQNHFTGNDLTEAIVGENGEQDSRPLTLGSVAETVLVMDLPNERAEGKEKFERWCLAKRIHDAAEPLNLEPEEAALLKERIGKGYSANVVGPAYAILNGAEEQS